MIDFSEIKLGKVVLFNDSPCVIIKCDFKRMQQAKPTKACILKNLITGNNVDYTYKSGESVEEAALQKRKASFMYSNDDELFFMIDDTFETVEIPRELLGDRADYLKDELPVVIQYFNDNPISIELPIKIDYVITETSDVVKGNSVSDISKDATIESGKIVKVPGFIKVGETVTINTETDEYAGRVTS